MNALQTRMSRRLHARALAALGALLLAACGGGGGDAPLPPPPNVTAAGGTVSSADGKATLVVPAGAASAAAHVTLEAVANPTLPADAAIVAGTTYRLGGDGGELAAEATLEIEADRAYPASAARKRAQYYIAAARISVPTIRIGCDFDSDDDQDLHDLLLGIAGAGPCHEPPTLAAIDTGLSVLGSCVIPNGKTTTCRLKNLAPKLVGILFDAVAPTIAIESLDFPVAPAQITSTGPHTLRVAASDNKGIARVDFYLAEPQGELYVEQKFASVAAPPYQASFTLGEADNGARIVYAEAVDTHGNRRSAGVQITVAIPPAPPADTTAPTVALASSPASALVGQGVTLSATANDNVGVTKVEFYRGANKLGEDTLAPYEFATAPYGPGDIGSVSYSAVASDAAGNSATSAAVTVVVSSASAQAWVSPSGSDANPGSSAAPLRTLLQAFTQVGAGGTVWLHNGLYDSAGEGLSGMGVYSGRSVPAGVAIRAVNDAGPTLGITLQFPAGGSVVGVNFDASGNGRVLASGGTLTLARPQWVKLGATVIDHGIVASGSAVVQLDPMGQANHNYVVAGLTGFASAAGTSELSVSGGRIEGSSGQTGAFVATDSAKLVLTNVTIANAGNAWIGGNGAVHAAGTANRIELHGTTIDLAGALAPCILQDRQIAGTVGLGMQIVVIDSVLTRCGGGGVQLREGTPQLLLQNVQVTDGGYWGVWVGQIGFDSTVGQYARPEISIIGTTISGYSSGAVSMTHGGSIAILDSTLASPAAGARGIHLQGTADYGFSLNGSSVSAGIDAIVLQGGANSVYVLGTTGLAGANSITGGSGTGLRVSVAAGATVHAIGNTWKANQQGADANGRYTVAGATCNGADPCEVLAGSGANYTFTDAGAGARLRLAGN